MTTPTHSQRFIAALAAICHHTRHDAGIQPAWDEPGIAAAIRRSAHIPAAPLAIAFIRGATDPRNTTPAALLHDDNRAWNDDHAWPCRTHPDNRARRPNGECAGCYADRRAAPYQHPARPGVPPTDEQREQLLAAIRRPATRPDPADDGERPLSGGTVTA